MEKNVKKVEMKNVVSALNSAGDERDIDRVLRKLANCNVDMNSLPEYLSTRNWQNAKPSNLTVMECLKVKAEFMEKEKKDVHPSNVIEVITSRCDIEFSPTKISYEEDGETVEIKESFGVFSDTPTYVNYAVAATAVAYLTNVSSTGISVTVNSRLCPALKMAKVELGEMRALLAGDIKSPPMARNSIFKTLINNSHYSFLLIDKIMEEMPYKNVSENHKKNLLKVQKYLNKTIKAEGGEKITRDPVGFQMVCTRLSYDILKVDLRLILSLRCVSNQTLGGTYKKKGSLFSSAYLGEISAHAHKAIVMVADIRRLCRLFNTKVVRIPNCKTYSLLMIKILVANGYIVINSRGQGVHTDQESGIFRMSLAQGLTLVDNPFPDFKYTTAGLRYEKDEVYSASFAVLESEKGVALTDITPQIIKRYKEGKITIVPSIVGYTVKCFVFTSDVKISDEEREKVVDDMLRRCLEHIYFKNNFVLTRRPVFFDDNMREFYQEYLTMRIPRVEKTEEKDIYSALVNIARESKVNDPDRQILEIDMKKYLPPSSKLNKMDDSSAVKAYQDKEVKNFFSMTKLDDQIAYYESCLRQKNDALVQCIHTCVDYPKFESSYRDYVNSKVAAPVQPVIVSPEHDSDSSTDSDDDLNGDGGPPPTLDDLSGMSTQTEAVDKNLIIGN